MKEIKNYKVMIVYILVIVGALLMIIGLILGLKTIDPKQYILFLSILIAFLGFFMYVGKFKQDVKTGMTASNTNLGVKKILKENQELIIKQDALSEQNKILKSILDEQSQIIETESNIRESKFQIDLKVTIKRYRDLEIKFFTEFSSLESAIIFSQYDNNTIKSYRHVLNLLVEEILNNSLVIEHEEIYSEWHLIRNEIIVYLNFLGLPDGYSNSEVEDGVERSFIISYEEKRKKLSKLSTSMTNKEISLNYAILKILDKNNLKEF